MIKFYFGGSVFVAFFVLVLCFFALDVSQASAQIAARSTLNSSLRALSLSDSKTDKSKDANGTIEADALEVSGEAIINSDISRRETPKTDSRQNRLLNNLTTASALQSFVATAYCLRGRTASGRNVARGLIAADSRVLPIGTRVRLEAGSYTGEYLVADTGGAVRGRKIDIWVPSSGEALRFGRQQIKLVVLGRAAR